MVRGLHRCGHHLHAHRGRRQIRHRRLRPQDLHPHRHRGGERNRHPCRRNDREPWRQPDLYHRRQCRFPNLRRHCGRGFCRQRGNLHLYLRHHQPHDRRNICRCHEACRRHFVRRRGVYPCGHGCADTECNGRVRDSRDGVFRRRWRDLGCCGTLRDDKILEPGHIGRFENRVRQVQGRGGQLVRSLSLGLDPGYDGSDAGRRAIRVMYEQPLPDGLRYRLRCPVWLENGHRQRNSDYGRERQLQPGRDPNKRRQRHPDHSGGQCRHCDHSQPLCHPRSGSAHAECDRSCGKGRNRQCHRIRDDRHPGNGG